MTLLCLIWPVPTNYCARALKKNAAAKEPGMDKAMHYVVSRSPVIGTAPVVINYN